MRTIRALALIVAACVSPPAASAFERCDRLFASPDELRDFVFDQGARNAPMKYFERAKSVRIDITSEPGRLIPVATFDRERRPVIVYPSAFPALLCRMTLATTLVLDGETQPADEAARDAGACITPRRPRESCLADYARDLERRYRTGFAALTEQGQRLAYTAARDALAQIAKHEYAHHLLGHAERIRSGSLARIDAEFEADFYAMLTGIQSGQLAGAMYYFFSPLGDMEDYAESLKSPDYESGNCRATNVNDITRLFGIAPQVLLDALWGGGDFRNAKPDLVRTIAEEIERDGPPEPSANSCGRLARVVLREAHVELTSLTALVAEYADVLPATPTADPSGGRELSRPEVFTLIDRLQTASRDLKHLNGLAARALSILIGRVDLAGVSSQVSQQLEHALQSSRDDILGSDYGRILKVKAVSILYEARAEPLAARLDAAQSLLETSVTLLPEGSEGWMALAQIALARGDCDKAAQLAHKSALTASDEARAMAEAFRDGLREVSASGRCAEAGERFATSTFGR
jgi:hypothetical protein